MLISPRHTDSRCGNSSSRVLRSSRPARVIRTSSGVLHRAWLSHPDAIHGAGAERWHHGGGQQDEADRREYASAAHVLASDFAVAAAANEAQNPALHIRCMVMNVAASQPAASHRPRVTAPCAALVNMATG